MDQCPRIVAAIEVSGKSSERKFEGRSTIKNQNTALKKEGAYQSENITAATSQVFKKAKKGGKGRVLFTKELAAPRKENTTIS